MEGLKSQINQAFFRARSLVWFQRVFFFDRLIRHQPSELGIPGSNPGAPATHYSFDIISPNITDAPIKKTNPKGTEISMKPTGSITHIGSPIPSSGCTSITYQNRNGVATNQTIKLLIISNSPLCHCFKQTYPLCTLA